MAETMRRVVCVDAIIEFRLEYRLQAVMEVPADATELEVTHWWTSGGEAAAVAEFAKAFDATGNHWVDGAIAGSGSTARPIMISRITGGDPMAATQFAGIVPIAASTSVV